MTFLCEKYNRVKEKLALYQTTMRDLKEREISIEEKLSDYFNKGQNKNLSKFFPNGYGDKPIITELIFDIVEASPISISQEIKGKASYLQDQIRFYTRSFVITV